MIRRRKKTKPSAKNNIEVLLKEIKSGNISDDDLKIVGDTLAESIESGQSAMRVGTKVVTAVKSHLKKTRKPVKPKPIDTFDRIRKHIRNAIDGLTFWADGTIKPENIDEAGCAKAILASAANMIIQYARLGIDVRGVYQTFIEGSKKEPEPKGLTLDLDPKTDFELTNTASKDDKLSTMPIGKLHLAPHLPGAKKKPKSPESVRVRNKKYLPTAKFLAKIVQDAKDIRFPDHQISSWTTSIRKLVECNGIDHKRIRTALKWYKKHINDEYVPVIESGSSLRAKFLKLETAMKRQAKHEEMLKTG